MPVFSKIKRIDFLRGLLLALLVVLCFTSCFKDLTQLTVIYENNFDNYDQKGIIISTPNGIANDIRIKKFNDNPVLGMFNNTRIDLAVQNLPAHRAMTVSFDLYIHDKWVDDLWKLTYDGNDYVLYSFSNDPTVQQWYPNAINSGAKYPAKTDAYTINLPGACLLSTSPQGTTMYKIEQTFLHNNTSFHFSCSDAGSAYNIPCTRSWSIDNLKITMIKN